MNHKQKMTNMLIENSAALKDFKALIKGDKELSKMKGVDRLDKMYQKYEKEIEKIEKKYKLGMDELGQLLMKL